MSGPGEHDGRRHAHVPHEPYEWREPGGADAPHKPKQSTAGNGTVNHGLDDQSPSGGLDSDELALRRMLQHAVEEIEPRDGTLDHLRTAVPARRARKRQALVGMAAAALFVGTAVPALLHVSGATGSDADPFNAGHSSQTQGGASQGKGPDGGESTSGGSSSKVEDKDKGSSKEDDEDKGTGTGTGGSDSSGPSATSTAGVPACTATDLGIPTASVDPADSAGAVYGTFTFTNGSTAACLVTGPGSVVTATAGAADSTKVAPQRHVSGDAAVSLPDPSLELASLSLQPGSSYIVRFAWVPSETCPVDNGDGGTTGGPTTTPSPTENSGTTEGTSTGGDTGTSTQLMTADGTQDGSVTITGTAEGGTPSTSATLTNACAGTVYWTGVLTPTA
ncbi:DUF4232 domain-containing protein [Streptomyces sp. NBC_00124]|uniref:hypothetical protein n=1 Tax=Streptomyces sp. NBC_00124 TaxID=2975662 RepID=UPI0022510EF5|nr:hypothetical protein [Streptomyces sp. NBC_00124]MCX5361941.1 DUF4232 domain-containing protein [Streptomyces sp. NBC_00124]